MNLLFTCSGRRHYLLNYFKEALGNRGLVIAIDSQSTAPSFAAADLAFQVPSIYDPEYLGKLKEIIKSYQIKAVVPLNDLELPLLSRNKEELERLGARLIVSNPEFINTCSDKWETFQYLKQLKIATPKSFLKISDTLKSISKGEICFPLIVKPRWGSGSFGIEIVDNELELQLAFELLKIRLKKSFLKNMNSNNVDEAIIIQEKLIGVEYGMDVVNDLNGEFQFCFAKEKLAMRSGETDKAKTVVDEKFTEIAKKISVNSKHLGIMDVDFFLKDGIVHILELNPRFGGGYPFTHEAGGNVAEMYLEWLNDKIDVSIHNKFKTQVIFSKYDRLVGNHITELDSVVG